MHSAGCTDDGRSWWGGSIVNISTIEGIRPPLGFAAYAAARQGSANHQDRCGLDLVSPAFGSSGSAPDFTSTESLSKMAPNGERAPNTWFPLGRAGHVDDMVGAAAFLQVT